MRKAGGAVRTGGTLVIIGLAAVLILLQAVRPLHNLQAKPVSRGWLIGIIGGLAVIVVVVQIFTK
ncbi:hypothetical protein [Petropleomorpha daqingensis]|uniref:Uncharacterized protein n=1 Tax=Petropleomorpha daqingensis TaxID=2026353 RepID=A0A853CKG9_9ACTN|nr:hypothetical protein [Petropleomorpha daqingensis]NYJ07032.1 hypothetical protein [Petropleomorpha daqingensis]